MKISDANETAFFTALQRAAVRGDIVHLTRNGELTEMDNLTDGLCLGCGRRIEDKIHEIKLMRMQIGFCRACKLILLTRDNWEEREASKPDKPKPTLHLVKKEIMVPE